MNNLYFSSVSFPGFFISPFPAFLARSAGCTIGGVAVVVALPPSLSHTVPQCGKMVTFFGGLQEEGRMGITNTPKWCLSNINLKIKFSAVFSFTPCRIRQGYTAIF
jgi:hypothetical protein